MIVGFCTIELRIPMSHSLKNKRGILKSIINRIKNRFNVSIAEVANHDDWKLATVGIVTISNDTVYIQQLLNKVIEYIENNYLDVQLFNHIIEFL
ncbi:hypothetical protein U472_07855 [Orenia metallireducens]|uniref:DUF503 domain-containing protein n=2 Tax=Orenia metallireducens TaxID=1413210 RepID=A0A1C0AAP6_9FIRM|nr:hypothetical protein U472_07855 [Orenia metallireducens]